MILQALLWGIHPPGGSFFVNMTPPAFYKLYYGGSTLRGVIVLKNGSFCGLFNETEKTCSEISCRIHRLSRPDQLSRPVHEENAFLDFAPLPGPPQAGFESSILNPGNHKMNIP